MSWPHDAIRLPGFENGPQIRAMHVKTAESGLFIHSQTCDTSSTHKNNKTGHAYYIKYST